MRAVLVPIPIATVDHVVSATDGSGSSREWTGGREPRECKPDPSNIGNLSPVPSGFPDSDVDVRIFMRSAGDTGDGGAGGSRWGFKDTAHDNYCGKHPGHILRNPVFLEYQTSSTYRIIRPKALELLSGGLLVVYVQNSLFVWRIFTPGTGWSAAANVSIDVPMATKLGVDVVQCQDTGEIIAIALGRDANDHAVMARWTSRGDTASTIAWRPSLVSYTNAAPYFKTGANILVSFGIEQILPSGRIALLAQTTGSGSQGLWRSYSDNRGAKWSQWSVAGDYGVMPAALTTGAGALIPTASYWPTCDQAGGVSIVRTKTGALLATAPARFGNINAFLTTDTDGRAWPVDIDTARQPRIRLLVSEDGDNWGDCVRASAALASGAVSAADGLFDEGVCESAVCVGDDGLPRILGWLGGKVQQGEVESPQFTPTYGDLGLLTLRKGYVSAADVGPTIPFNVVTSSDLFDATAGKFSGVPEPTRFQLSMTRISVLSGITGTKVDTAAVPTGGYWEGFESLEVVNYRGALWFFGSGRQASNMPRFVALDLTVPEGYQLFCGQFGGWSELNERSPNVSDAAKALRGYPYTYGYLPFRLPEHCFESKNDEYAPAWWNQAEWVKTGSGTVSLFALAGVDNGGLLISADGAPTYYTSNDTGGLNSPGLPGTKNAAAMLHGFVQPGTAAGISADDCFVGLRLSNGSEGSPADTEVRVRVSQTSIELFDVNADASLGSLTGRDYSNGVEFCVSTSDFNHLTGFFARPIKIHDPEDAVWENVIAPSPPTVLTQNDSGTSNFLQFGCRTSVANNAFVMRGLWFSRATAVGAGTANLFTATKAWDAGTPKFDEFVLDPVGFDDGMQHGCRAPIASPFPAYLRKGLRCHFVGSAGAHGDFFDVKTDFSFDKSRVLRVPVSSYWRSGTASDTAQILFDGSAGGVVGVADGLHNPTHLFLQGVNAGILRVDFSASSSFTSPTSIVLDVTDPAGSTVFRDVWRRASSSGTPTLVREGPDNRIVRLTGDAASPFRPNQWMSTSRKVWYLWVEEDGGEGAKSTSGTSYRIVGNTETSLLLSAPVVSSIYKGRVSIYCDRMAIAIPSLPVAGLRYMRVVFPGAQILPEGFYKINYGPLACRVIRLDLPHPEWTVNKRLLPVTTRLEGVPSGYVDRALRSEARELWTMAWAGLRGRESQASVTDNPGFTRSSHQAIAELLRACQWGALPVVLLPEYNDRTDHGFQTHEAILCQVSASFELTQNHYDCLSSENLIQMIGDVTPIVFEEIA